jgi:hypothetical protein
VWRAETGALLILRAVRSLSRRGRVRTGTGLGQQNLVASDARLSMPKLPGTVLVVRRLPVYQMPGTRRLVRALYAS